MTDISVFCDRRFFVVLFIPFFYDQLNAEGVMPFTSAELREREVVQKRLDALSEELPILDREMGLTWFAALEKEFHEPYFKELNDFIMRERSRKTILPPPKDVWSWTKYCRINMTKVVIIGTEPYSRLGQADGLCFSVPVGVPKPPTLENIFKELLHNYKKFENPSHGFLMGWAMQGVLLLNSILTVEVNKPTSHRKRGWEKFTDAVLKYINDNLDHVVFLIWGPKAYGKIEDIVDKKIHFLLKAGYPSPRLAHHGFFGCRHFKTCNKILTSKDEVIINWEWLPEAELITGENSNLKNGTAFHKDQDREQTKMFEPVRLTSEILAKARNISDDDPGYKKFEEFIKPTYNESFFKLQPHLFE